MTKVLRDGNEIAFGAWAAASAQEERESDIVAQRHAEFRRNNHPSTFVQATFSVSLPPDLLSKVSS